MTPTNQTAPAIPGCISRLVVDSSDTPETDASVNRVEKNGLSPIIEYCYANDARRIERERDGLQRGYDAAIRQMNEAIAKVEWYRTDAIADIERERDAAIDALKKWDAACKAADDCNSEMNSESYCQPLWEAFEKIHSQLLEEADRARIAVLSNLSDNAKHVHP